MRRALFATAALLLVAACQRGADGEIENQAQITAAAAGAVLGGVLGAVIDSNDARGVGVGAAAGAIGGAVIGSLFDDQQKEFEQTLADEQSANDIEIERLRDDLLRINLNNEVSFDLDSATINPAFSPTLQKLADVLNKFDRSHATIIGHTDSTGSNGYNQSLSERRAQAVAAALTRHGVPSVRLDSRGAGESQPRADNATESGRQLNRRVEILVSPSTA